MRRWCASECRPPCRPPCIALTAPHQSDVVFAALQNSELLTLTYGAVVTQVRSRIGRQPQTRRQQQISDPLPNLQSFPVQLIRDYEDPVEVNAQLEQM
jgi:hypothetical protein